MAKKENTIAKQKINNALIGHSGECLAASELCRRGYIATLTLSNTEGMDIFAATENYNRIVGIQVRPTHAPVQQTRRKIPR